MGKYSDEFKHKVVKEYLEGKLGYRATAKIHGIKVYSNIDSWEKVYGKFGQEGLTTKKHPVSYPVQLKMDEVLQKWCSPSLWANPPYDFRVFKGRMSL
ncbi:helix-turn-helix domain-containing protein [Neobacillus dielmonensis]|uniref:helix-turn-helix domain-containing protein n=1 Tax=Neobacillus dielmonensis TaxID=1347369 RepID=UPI0006941D5F|nr:helix-turn-helix domain-containing protein [Neobacillus dielmonensis]